MSNHFSKYQLRKSKRKTVCPPIAKLQLKPRQVRTPTEAPQKRIYWALLSSVGFHETGM